MTATKGHIVRTPAADKPYKVVLEHERGGETEHPISSIREGEALIRSATPTPPKANQLREFTG